MIILAIHLLSIILTLIFLKFEQSDVTLSELVIIFLIPEVILIISLFLTFNKYGDKVIIRNSKDD